MSKKKKEHVVFEQIERVKTKINKITFNNTHSKQARRKLLNDISRAKPLQSSKTEKSIEDN